MKNYNKLLSKYREVLLVSIDIVFVIISYITAYFIRVDFGTLFSLETFKPVIIYLPLTILINLGFSLLLRVNKTLWQYISIDEVVRVCVSIFLSNIVILVLLFIFNVNAYPKTVPIIAMLILVILMLGIRVIYRMYRRNVMQSHRNHRALIIGAGQAGAIILKDLTLTDRYDCKVVGFVDDDLGKKGKIISGIEVLGTTDKL